MLALMEFGELIADTINNKETLIVARKKYWGMAELEKRINALRLEKNRCSQIACNASSLEDAERKHLYFTRKHHIEGAIAELETFRTQVFNYEEE